MVDMDFKNSILIKMKFLKSGLIKVVDFTTLTCRMARNKMQLGFVRTHRYIVKTAIPRFY